MNYYLSASDSVTMLAPSPNGCIRGKVYTWDDLLGVAATTTPAGTEVVVNFAGFYRLDKDPTFSAPEGTRVYWEPNTGLIGLTGTPIGILTAPAIEGEPTADVHLRKRVDGLRNWGNEELGK